MSRFRCDAVVDQGRRDFFFRGAAAATMLAASGAATPVRAEAAEATDKQKKFMAEANRLAVESVRKGWGGPFGAVIVKDGEIIGRGQKPRAAYRMPGLPRRGHGDHGRL